MVKSKRNRGSCQESQLSAGADVNSTCPPELTSKVKTALEKEIASFNAKKTQDVIEREAVGSSALDAYHDWVDRNGGEEPLEANPDVLSEEEGVKFTRPEMSDEEVNLLKEVRHLFSTRELQVWNMVMVHGLSHQNCADLLHIDIKSAEMYLKRAERKFMSFMEEKKNEHAH